MLHTGRYSEAARQADLRACRALLRGGSRSFYAASFLLPRRVRDPATALYAFCRLADDAIDLDRGSGHGIPAKLRARLDMAYAGEPLEVAADRAFADAVARHAIPRDLPEAMIEGFAWDKAQRRYDTIEDVLAYAARVAGTVGAMMSILMGCREKAVVARACDLGMAMQLTNIARDVGEDAVSRRIYLPRQWLCEAGIDPERWLSAPHFTPPLAAVIRRLLEVADQLYARSDLGIGRLPPDCRPGIAAARLLYAEIGHEVARRHWNSIELAGGRPRPPQSRIAGARALGRGPHGAAQRSAGSPCRTVPG